MKIIALLLLILLSACMPKQTAVSPGALEGEGGTTSTTTGGYTTSDTMLGWYYLYNTTNSITFARSNSNFVYLRGQQIENYLKVSNNLSQTYCIEINLGDSVPAPYRLRARAMPVSVNDLVTKLKTIYLRVELDNLSANSVVCNKDTVEYVDDLNTNAVNFATVSSQVAFGLSTWCPQCLTQLPAQKIRLFKLDGSLTPVLRELRRTDIDFSAINFYFDGSSSTAGSGSCSNTNCRSRGYDCCLEGQCVNDKTIRSEVDQNSQAFITVANLVAANPLAIFNYPQYYYICPQSQNTDPDNGGGGSGQDEDAAAQQRLEQLRKDYTCIEHLKEKSPSTPFHLQPYDSSATYDSAKCNVLDSSNLMYWEKVLIRLYDNCGCDDQPTLNEKLLNCPKYEYLVKTQNAQGIPTEFECSALDESGPGLPFQNLNVNVSSRSAPHRFFKGSDGTEVNLSGTIDNSITQEGDPFTYLDPQKVMPVNGSFNMNSILGQMTVSLDLAVPAKVIDIEVDRSYLIATKSGYHTPCSTCAKDSWFANFTATPATSQGVGLRSIGHTTERDAWSTNLTGGNYEDTVFGRACWVPPTMLPFAHMAGSNTLNAQAQRLARLKAQAAMYVNGYQRDWFGFNRGALIGSFDGVSWFAVGKGRIVRSKTKKLFLAINAPFADLASNSMHVVSVQAYDNLSTAAVVDFDPTLAMDHPQQNEAGSCQVHHYCNTDTECVSKLGWEYMCADVRDLRTKWPEFDATTALEKPNSSVTVGLEAILAQGAINGPSTKRCVYRGAGSVCRGDSNSIGLVSNANKVKLLTCAPNFWCAPLTSSQAVFNKEVSRFARPLDELPVANNHFFGRDSNMLGRPLDYVTGSGLTTLPTDIRDSIRSNVEIYGGTSTLYGLCRPGKALVPTVSSTDINTWANPYQQHRNTDSYKRTDYINQIGACPSSIFDNAKTYSCPVIGDDGNYLMFNPNFISSAGSDYRLKAAAQNVCGLNAIKNAQSLSGTADTLLSYSPFRGIEGKTIASGELISTPTLARDACLRQAGAVCQTDLDCSPNKMHAEQSQYFDDSYFGNTLQRKYHEEYLVCGQVNSVPFTTDAHFATHDMALNRCCRPVGNDITSYSLYEHTGTGSGTAFDNTETTGINPLISIHSSPNSSARYSRYQTVQNLGTINYPVPSALDDRSTSNGALNGTTPSVISPNQWKTIGLANKNTCCGGGWIRKFADGGNDWTASNRFHIDPTNFKCLNYYSPLMTTASGNDFGVTQGLLENNLTRFCPDPTGAEGSCSQLDIDDNASNDLCSSVDTAGPTHVFEDPSTEAFLTTIPGNAHYGTATNKLFVFHNPVSADSVADTHYKVPHTSCADNTGRDAYKGNTRNHVKIYVPTYIDTTTLYNVSTINWTWKIQAVVKRGSSTYTVDCHLADQNGGLDSGLNDPKDGDDYNEGAQACYTGSGSYTPNPAYDQCTWGCCYHYDSTARILRLIHSNGTIWPVSGTSPGNLVKDDLVGARLSFKPPGTAALALLKPSTSEARAQSKPACSARHYLSILGRLELAGVPQISHEKITCNNNKNELVPGIFNRRFVKDGNQLANSFKDPAFAYHRQSSSYVTYNSDAPNSASGYTGEAWYTNHHGLENGAVFSEHDFKCCTPLGKTTKVKTNCCSGHGVATGTSGGAALYTCKLPGKTNLHVYFNRFISNEGVGADQPGGGLLDSDFSSTTGEIIIDSGANGRLTALGNAYCESGKVRRGGAFGEFLAEPATTTSSGAGQKVYGVVDSSADNGSLSSAGQTSQVGYNAFISGYRWNHHLYCEE